MNYIDFDTWQQAVKDAHPEEAHKIKFKGRVERGIQTVSAEIPGQDRCFGVWTEGSRGGSGQVLEAFMLEAKARLVAGIPDLDHMPGQTIKLKDLQKIEHPMLKKRIETFTDYHKWKAAVEKVNTHTLADNAEFCKASGSEWAECNGTCFAVWSTKMKSGHIDLQTAEELKKDCLEMKASIDVDELLEDIPEEQGEGMPAQGEQFDLLLDGEPEDEEPIVQEVTHDDGGIEPAEPVQDLLIDDLPH